MHAAPAEIAGKEVVNMSSSDLNFRNCTGRTH
jgi:hypothetical protein